MSNAFFDENIKTSIQIQLSWRYKSYSERFLSAIILFSFCRSFHALFTSSLSAALYIYFLSPRLRKHEIWTKRLKRIPAGLFRHESAEASFFPRYIGWLPFFSASILISLFIPDSNRKVGEPEGV